MSVVSRVAVTKTPETFDIFETTFRKITGGTKGMKDENNNSLCSLWFNRPYHNPIHRG